MTRRYRSTVTLSCSVTRAVASGGTSDVDPLSSRIAGPANSVPGASAVHSYSVVST